MDSDWKDLETELKVFAKWTISGLIDATFLVIWVFVQWLVSKVVVNLQLSGIDIWTLSTFQLLFAISTLTPIVVYIYVDLRIMLLRAQRRIRDEISLSESHGTDKS